MSEPRPPIVTVLGHVDHGKTTLLDAIRKTTVAVREAGGITQGIGASQVSLKVSGKDQKITFIDTPGHAAFSQMRSRGAKVADIAVLVVAADDGPKPQTKEALEFILKEKVPYIVALTKVDLPSADIENAKKELETLGVSFEGKGGNVPAVSISAKTGKGVSDLLEVIALVAEVGEIKADANADLEASVIETHKDNRGSLAAIIVRNGSLKTGDKILVEGKVTKVRGIFNDLNKQVDILLPGDPGLILGFEESPQIGAQIKKWTGEAETNQAESTQGKVTSQDNTELNLIIKADSAGSLEAIKGSLPEKVNVAASAVGDINEGDLFSAKASENCRIFAFKVKTPSSVKKLAGTEGVVIENFDLIYKLFERVDELITKKEEDILGKAEVIAIFPFDGKKVTGSKVKEGKISKGDILKLVREDKEIGQIKIISMKREKKDITQASAGEDFGMLLEPQLDFTIGDVLISVRK